MASINGITRGSWSRSSAAPLGFLPASHALLAAFLAMAICSNVGAQIVTKTNGLASYAYDASSAFVPGEPLAAASDSLSTFSFFPAAFSTSSSGGAPSSNSLTSTVALDINANPGVWFEGPLSMSGNAQANYSLAAPIPTSTARVDFAAPFTLQVTSVNGSPFLPSGSPLATNLTITPPFVSVSGPTQFPAGTINGSISLDIATIKLFFGIAAGSNVTGMRLMLSPTISAQSENGTASISLVNFDVASKVVPEPSTCVLLLAAGGLAGVYGWRRRRS